MLAEQFELGWSDIRKSDYVGDSHGYTPRQSSVGTTNGAGPRNTQMFVLSDDLVVVHALPGFWHPEDLARELRFALTLHSLWLDQGKSLAAKRRIAQRLHRREVYAHPAETYARSTWQGFDEAVELQRAQAEDRDTLQRGRSGEPALDPSGRMMLKPINVIAHERMARQQFVAWQSFDVEKFVDYGRPFYDLNTFETSRHDFD